MSRVDRDLHKAVALVADANPTSRSVLVAQLRDLGLAQVHHCGRAIDARAKLEARRYDIVVCERHFPETSYSGQALLDDLRRSGLLPFATVFIMVTGDAGYAQVAEAAEAALDIYLLKPYSAAMLIERIQLARRRKRALKPIFQAIEEGQFARAAALCLKRFEQRESYWLYAARIGAELLLRVGRVAEAQRAYQAVVECQAVPWARLGVARAQLEAGRTQEAVRTLQNLVDQQADFADAYDVMGRAQVELGQLEQALVTYRLAADITPGSVTRQQKLGMLAFYMGQPDEAASALERAVSAGAGSKVFDHQALVLLAVLRYLQRDRKGLQRCRDELSFALERRAGDARLARLDAVVAVFIAMINKQVGETVERVRALAAQLDQDSFDLEAACNLLLVISTLSAEELRLEDAGVWIERIGMRHASSKALTELLASAARAHEPHVRAMHDCHTRVLELAEDALSISLAGNPRGAVLALIGHALRTMNVKLVDTAAAVLQRHQSAVIGAEELADRVQALRGRWGLVDGKARLGRAHGREAGELVLRTTPSATVATAAAPASVPVLPQVA
jgi:CheY-like chemotaxis protein